MHFFDHKQRNNIILVIIIFLGLLILYSLQLILGAILSALVLYTLLRPGMLYFQNRGLSRRVIAIVFIVLSAVVIVLPFYGLSSMILTKIKEFQGNEIFFKNVLYKLQHNLPFNINKEKIELAVEQGVNFAAGLFPSFISGALNIVLSIIITFFLLYFMLVEHAQFENALLKYTPLREQNALRFAEEMQNTTYANVLGQGLICLVQGSLVSLSFFMLNYSDPIFWGVITTFICFVPVLGPPLVFVPAALLKIIDGHAFEGWAMIVFGFVVILNIDNVLRFIIAKRVGNIHPLITVIGVIIGIPLFGILGLVFGPLLLSYFLLLVKIYESSSIASKRLSRIKTKSDP